MRIVLIGEGIAESRTQQRLRALGELGHETCFVSTSVASRSYESRVGLFERIRYRLRLPGDPAAANAGLCAALQARPDIVWLDNARCIRPGTLRRAKAAGARVIWYSEDDMMNPRHRSRWIERGLEYFDLWVTTKSMNACPDELPTLGVRRILRVDNSFDPALHRPVALSSLERCHFGADIAFVGTFEQPRAESILALAKAGLAVRVWGNGWRDWQGRHPLMVVEGRPCYGEDYAKVVSASRINLCFLRKFNRDRQTCRSIEIPACGGFMVHERTDEMLGLFAEGRDAAYFSDDAELIAVCRQWLADDAARRQVASNARKRVADSGLAHHDLLARALVTAMEVGA